MFNSGAGGDTIPPSPCLTRYGRVTSEGYPTLGTCTTLQCHFYNATCPHRCIHESLLVLYQLGNYYGRYTLLTSAKKSPASNVLCLPPDVCYLIFCVLCILCLPHMDHLFTHLLCHPHNPRSSVPFPNPWASGHLLLLPVALMPSVGSCGYVMGAFRPDGLVFTLPCKVYQAKVLKE